MSELELIDEIERISDELDNMVHQESTGGALGSIGDEFYRKKEKLQDSIIAATDELLKRLEDKKYEHSI